MALKVPDVMGSCVRAAPGWARRRGIPPLPVLQGQIGGRPGAPVSAHLGAEPLAVKFFLGFGSSDLQPLLSVGKYLDFVITFVLPFGFIFELPLFIVVLAKLGIVGSAFLWKKQRLVIFMAFVIGAVISPTPDVFSQSMIAVPMILLYEISWFIVRFILRK